MIKVTLKPLRLRHEIVSQCSECKKVISRGNTIILAARNEVISGYICDSLKICCGIEFGLPMLFQSIPIAEIQIRKLQIAGPGVNLGISSKEVLIELLAVTGATLAEAQLLYMQYARAHSN